MNTEQRPSNQIDRRPPESFVDEANTKTVMAEAMSSRSVQEVQAALVVAKKFPRDEFMALQKIKTACQRKGLAEVSEYEYARGGTTITGPTIDLLKAIAKRWGNIDYGWQELERKNGESVIRAFAWDMESNARSSLTFNVRHWRDTKQGGYALKDERDIYETTANFAARRVRACLESVIDGDIVATAVEECRKTLAGGGKEPLVDRVRQMVSAFAEFGITPGMIQQRLQNKLEAVSEIQLAGLRRVYKSLKDGVGTREDFFTAEGVNLPKEPEDNVPMTFTPTGGGTTAGPIYTDAERAEALAAKLKAETKLAPSETPKPNPETNQPKGEKIHTIQETLAEQVIAAGFTFDEFRKWLDGIGEPNVTSWADWSEIPLAVAQRLTRGKTMQSVLKGIGEMKGKLL